MPGSRRGSFFFAQLPPRGAENEGVGRHVDGQRGAVQTEYVVLLALVSVGMTVALVAVGGLLVSYHDVIDGLCGLPFP